MNRQHSTPKKRQAPRWEKAFLESLAITGMVSTAAATAQIHRDTAYKRRKTHQEFEEAWDTAIFESADLLADEAMRRAIEGTRKYKFDSHGNPLTHPETGEPYYELDYSDTLLIFLLKGRDPARYGDYAKEIRQMQKDVAELQRALNVAQG